MCTSKCTCCMKQILKISMKAKVCAVIFVEIDKAVGGHLKQDRELDRVVCKLNYITINCNLYCSIHSEVGRY